MMNKFFFSFVWIFFCNTLHAAEKSYECSLKENGLSHYLMVHEMENEIVDFDYIAVSFIDGGPPYPSCSIKAFKEGKKKERSSWHKLGQRWLIQFNDSADDGDSVLIEKNGSKYDFDFSNVNSLNCGQSSGIAEKISIKFDKKKCQVQKVRN